MDQGAINWLYKQCHKQFWRVCSWYDFDDLVQDGYLCYYIVRDRYKDAVTPEHIMSLFKITFINHVHDLATKRTKQASEFLLCDLISYSETSEDTFLDTLLPFEQYLAQFVETLQDAPSAVKSFLRFIATDDGLEKLRRPYRRRFSSRETTNQRWCRLIGVDPKKIDLPKALVDCLVPPFAVANSKVCI